MNMDAVNKVLPTAGNHTKRVGMNHAAFGACELGRQLREKKIKERKAKRELNRSMTNLKSTSSFNRMRAYSKQRPLFMEMLKTEQAYVDSLHVVVSRFMLPLQVALESYPAGILDKTEISAIFGNIAQLFEVNMELLRIIEDNLGMEDDPSKQAEKSDDNDLAAAFAEAFTNMLPVFKAFYAVYANNYEHSIKKMEECRVNNLLFSRLLATCQKHEDCRGLDLGDLLIKPVQRVCKYPLFFRELLKCTDESHPMYSKLLAASNAVAGIADRVNQTGRDTENALQSFRIAGRLEGLDKYDPTLQVVAPGRRFLQEFHCKLHYSFQEPGAKPTKEMRHAPYKKKPRECFLFNDALLVTKALGEKLEFRFWLELENVLVTIPPSHQNNSNGEGVDGEAGSGANDGFSTVQKRMPLDIVRIRLVKPSTRINESCASPMPPNSIAKCATTHRRSTSTNGSIPVVEKYTLWFRTTNERKTVYGHIQVLQEALENRAKQRVNVLSQQKKDKEKAASQVSVVPLAADTLVNKSKNTSSLAA